MSNGQKAEGQEPSMEDILASIRRILSEDAAAPSARPDGGPPEPVALPPAERPDLPPDDLAADFAESLAAQLADERARDREPARRQQAVPEPDPTALDESLFDDPVEPPLAEVPPPAPPRPAPPPRSAPGPTAAADDVLMLSPDMRASGHKLVSAATAADSADVLSQLARAILDRRELAVGGHSVTLESMVREMLRPLLREWLDRNLPYLIERLVRKEIDMMVARAERLED